MLGLAGSVISLGRPETLDGESFWKQKGHSGIDRDAEDHHRHPSGERWRRSRAEGTREALPRCAETDPRKVKTRRESSDRRANPAPAATDQQLEPSPEGERLRMWNIRRARAGEEPAPLAAGENP